MNIAQIDDVELISIKTKTLQDLDNELNLNLPRNRYNDLNRNTDANFCEYDFNAKAHTEDNKSFNERDEEENGDEHYESSVHYVSINKSPNGACGFHLTRSKWDPYPWVSAVDNFTPAAKSDLKAGDCILEVNGCDVLGLRISEIAKLVKSSSDQVTLLIWSSNCNTKCDEESLCAAPMPRSLQRLSLVVQMVLNLIECPVCLDTITPPAMQCQNGHLLCVNCRIRAEKCPVCRDRYFPRPALIAEQIQSAITSAFNLCRNEDKVRQKIFGRHNRQRQMVKTTLECLQQKRLHQHQSVYKSLTAHIPAKDERTTTSSQPTTRTSTINRKCDRNVTDKCFKCAHCSINGNKTKSNKFFTKFLNSKASSMENLTNGHNNTAATIATATNNIPNTCHTKITSAISQLELLDAKLLQEQQIEHKQVGECRALFKDFASRLQEKTSSVTNTNQFNDLPSNFVKNHHYLLTHKPNRNTIETDLNINSKLCCKQMLNNKMQHLLLSSDTDIKRTKKDITCVLESPGIFKNDKNKISWPTIVCETTYATIPRAIKFKETYCEKQALCQNDAHAGKRPSIDFLKAQSSSMSSLHLSLARSSTSTIPDSLCCSTSSFSSETQNSQSSLSSLTSPDIASSFSPSAAH